MPILRQGQEAEFTLPLGGYVSIDAKGSAIAEIALGIEFSRNVPTEKLAALIADRKAVTN